MCKTNLRDLDGDGRLYDCLMDFFFWCENVIESLERTTWWCTLGTWFLYCLRSLVLWKQLIREGGSLDIECNGSCLLADFGLIIVNFLIFFSS